MFFEGGMVTVEMFWKIWDVECAGCSTMFKDAEKFSANSAAS
jgi:hypothetical protein